MTCDTRSIPFGRPMIGEAEKAAVLEVLSGPILTHGPRVKAFEAAFASFTGAPHAVATASCTAALQLAYTALGVRAGDDVLVPAQTHVATAHAVELCGGTPVFVDSEPETGNIDIAQLETRMTARTKGVAVVHYLGMPVDMARVLAVARRHGLFVVEDCALALGSTCNGVHAGLHGDAGCFSFYPVKHITTAEGGMLITGRRDIADQVAKLRAFGIDRNIVSERAMPGMYDVDALGGNFRLNEIGAALGVEQMKRLPDFLARRRANYRLLTEKLEPVKGVRLLRSTHREFQSSYYCHAVLLEEPLRDKRREVIAMLKEKGIGTSIYYPRPLPHLSYYMAKYGFDAASFPVAAEISGCSIALPVGPHLGAEDITCIAAGVEDAIAAVKTGSVSGGSHGAGRGPSQQEDRT
ncbi:MAG: DegT/DnrJ/EryC1/StrS family aminotransferase [Kiritimatiellae bacterium]|nr:DegT/DnrJ/EryC1/StrS family aminotransferase [Kiritimatiellia bacterium]